MPKIFHSSIFTILLLVLPMAVTHAQSINFYQGPFSGIAKQAKETGKPFIVYFSMKECPSCEKMDTTSFQDPAVINYLNEHFLIQKVDAFSLEQGGMEQAQHFQVTSFPTIMFFRSDCAPFYEVGGYIEAGNLLGNLQKEYSNTEEMKRMANQNVSFCAAHLQHFQPTPPAHPSEPSYIIEYPASFKNIVKPEEMIASTEKRGISTTSRDIPVKFNPNDLAANPYSQRNTDPIKGALDPKKEPKKFEVRFREQEAVGSKSKTPKPKPVVEENTEMEQANADIEPSNSFERGPKAPDMRIKSASKRGMAKNESSLSAGVYEISDLPNAMFGIQIGAFTDKKVLDNALNEYQSKLEEVYVLCETEVNEVYYYKLVIGAFSSREEALSKKQEVENELGISTFILSYDKVR